MRVLFLLTMGLYSATSNYQQECRSADRIFGNLREVNKDVLPGFTSGAALQLDIQFSLLSLLGFDEISGEITVVSVLEMQWQDEDMPHWDPTRYCNMTSLMVSKNRIWAPQLLLMNPSNDVKDITKSSSLIRISYDGVVQWDIVTTIQASCSVNVAFFPFDDQTCSISVAPWGYNGDEIFVTASLGNGYEDLFSPNSAWDMHDLKVKGNEINGSDPMMSVLLSFKRRHEYFVVNILMPAFILALLNPLVFILPSSSGERTSFSITCFLAFCVFMSVLADNMPQNSYPMAHFSYLMMYFIIQSACVMLVTIVTLRVYHKDGFDDVPKWLQVSVKLLRGWYCMGPSKRTRDVTWKTVSGTLDVLALIGFLAWIIITSMSTLATLILG